MRSRLIWVGFALTVAVALALNNDGDAQPPGKKGFGKKGGGSVSTDQVISRLMSFDKNDDGKITTDELPERMQHLVALGDVNKDGALDRNEVTQLANTLASVSGLFTTALPGGGPGGDGGPGGFKGKGGPKGNAQKGVAGDVRRALDDLNVSTSTRTKADRVLRQHQEKARQLEELSQAELLMEMKGVLNDEDYRALKSAVEAKGPRTFGSSTAQLRTQIDRLQKDLEALRAKLTN